MQRSERRERGKRCSACGAGWYRCRPCRSPCVPSFTGDTGSAGLAKFASVGSQERENATVSDFPPLTVGPQPSTPHPTLCREVDRAKHLQHLMRPPTEWFRSLAFAGHASNRNYSMGCTATPSAEAKPSRTKWFMAANQWGPSLQGCFLMNPTSVPFSRI